MCVQWQRETKTQNKYVQHHDIHVTFRGHRKGIFKTDMIKYLSSGITAVNKF